MRTFKDIIAWQKSYELTLSIYRLTAKFPKCEEFGLKAQLRRASVSIISNIAEGFKRYGLKDRLYFYKIAECSLEEVKCQTMLSRNLDYLNNEKYKEICNKENETGKNSPWLDKLPKVV